MVINPVQAKRLLSEEENGYMTQQTFFIAELLASNKNKLQLFKEKLKANAKNIDNYLTWLCEEPELPQLKEISIGLTNAIKKILAKPTLSLRDVSPLQRQLKKLTQAQADLTPALTLGEYKAFGKFNNQLSDLLKSENEYAQHLASALISERKYRKIFNTDSNRTVFATLEKNFKESNIFLRDLKRESTKLDDFIFSGDKEKVRTLLGKVDAIHQRYTQFLKSQEQDNKAVITLGRDKITKHGKIYKKIEAKLTRKYEKENEKRQQEYQALYPLKKLEFQKREELNSVLGKPSQREKDLLSHSVKLLESLNELGLDSKPYKFLDEARTELLRIEAERLSKIEADKQAKIMQPIRIFDNVFKEIIDSENTYRSRLAAFLEYQEAMLKSERELGIKEFSKEFFEQLKMLINLSDQFLTSFKNLNQEMQDKKFASPQERIKETLDRVNAIYNSSMQNIANSIIKSVDLMSQCTKVLSNPKVYKNLRKSDPKFNLAALAIEPVQRGPRYMLLARELVSRGEKAGVDISNFTFLETADKEMKRVNEARRLSEENEKAASEKTISEKVRSVKEVSEKTVAVTVKNNPVPVLFLAKLTVPSTPSVSRNSISSVSPSVSSDRSNTPPPIPRRPRLQSLPDILNGMREISPRLEVRPNSAPPIPAKKSKG